MAEYANNIIRFAELVREIKGKTRFFKGFTAQQVIENPQNNVFPLYSETGDVMMLVTSYISSRTQGQYETAVGSQDSILCAVNFEDSADGTTMKYMGAVSTIDMDDACQMAFNAAGLIQTGPAIINQTRGRSGVTSTGAGAAVSHSSHAAGERSFSSHVVQGTGGIRNGSGGHGGIVTQPGIRSGSGYQTPAVVASDDDGNVKSFLPIKLINYVFEMLRQMGMWKKSYEAATRYETHEEWRVYNSSLSTLMSNVVNGYRINSILLYWPPDISNCIAQCWNTLATSYNMQNDAVFWLAYCNGGIPYTLSNNSLTLTVEFTVYALQAGVNDQLLFKCEAINVDTDNPDFSSRVVLTANAPMEFGVPRWPNYRYHVKATYTRQSVDSSWVLSGSIVKDTSYNNYQQSAVYSLYRGGTSQIFISGCEISKLAVTWVQQDPQVTPPENPGDGVDIYPKWVVKPQIDIQVGFDPNFEFVFEPHIEINLTIDYESDQPNHERETDGTIVNNHNETVVNDNSVLNQWIIYYIIYNQYYGNPDDNVDKDVSDGGPGLPPTGDSTVPDQGSVEMPVVPTFHGLQGEMYNMYLPIISQVKDFNAWLWSSNILDVIMKYFSSPFESIMSFGITYVDPNSRSFTDKIVLGPTYWPAGSDVAYTDEQYVTLNCGTVKINHYFNSSFDYEPFTSISAYLPFIGIVEWSASDIIDSSVTVSYNIDLLTGSSLCIVYVQKTGGVQVPLYQYECNTIVNLPLSSADYSRIYAALIGGAAKAAAGIATGGAGAIAMSMATGAADALAGSHNGIPVFKSGNVGSTAGAMGPKTPYIIIRRRNPYMPQGYSALQGYPSNEKVVLGSLKGYTRVREVHIEGVPATDQELDMIETLLKGGVIL